MAKLADAPDLGSGAARRVGSTPIIRTKGQREFEFECEGSNYPQTQTHSFFWVWVRVRTLYFGLFFTLKLTLTL